MGRRGCASRLRRRALDLGKREKVILGAVSIDTAPRWLTCGASQTSLALTLAFPSQTGVSSFSIPLNSKTPANSSHSITTATDTELLRVVMAAVEGALLLCVLVALRADDSQQSECPYSFTPLPCFVSPFAFPFSWMRALSGLRYTHAALGARILLGLQTHRCSTHPLRQHRPAVEPRRRSVDLN